MSLPLLEPALAIRLARAYVATPMGRQLAVVCIASLALGACATAAPSPGSRDVRFGGAEKHEGPAVSEVELQQDLQRFTGQFTDLITQAASTAFDPSDSKQQQAALHRVLIWDSSALDIATGPFPEINLLDMVVFITLCRSTIEKHWAPNVFGDRGAPLIAVFKRAERNIWQISAKVMTSAQQTELRTLIAQWQAEHPDQVEVESVRFTDFSAHAGQIETERAKSMRGLFGGVRAATSAADRAVLLGDRAMFLTNRMPFLIRLQARLGAQEMTDDAFVRLNDVDALLSRTKDLQPLVNDLAVLVARAESAAREARELVKELDPLVTYATQPSAEPGASGRSGLERALDTSDRLLDKANILLNRSEKLAAGAKGPLQLASEQADRMVRRWIAYLLILGAAWSVLFWGGYYLVKRRLTPPMQVQIAPTRARAVESRRGHALRVRPASSVHVHARRRAHGTTRVPRAPGSDEP